MLRLVCRESVSGSNPPRPRLSFSSHFIKLKLSTIGSLSNLEVPRGPSTRPRGLFPYTVAMSHPHPHPRHIFSCFPHPHTRVNCGQRRQRLKLRVEKALHIHHSTPIAPDYLCKIPSPLDPDNTSSDKASLPDVVHCISNARKVSIQQWLQQLPADGGDSPGPPGWPEFAAEATARPVRRETVRHRLHRSAP